MKDLALTNILQTFSTDEEQILAPCLAPSDYGLHQIQSLTQPVLTILIRFPHLNAGLCRPRSCDCSTLRSFYIYSDVLEYVALSHTWGDEEVTFQDVTANLGRKKKGWNKILGSSTQAAKA
jgi:hypothetical protein